MNSENLPSVLIRPNGNSISIERALKHIRGCLLYSTCSDEAVNVALDDVEAMLDAINRD